MRRIYLILIITAGCLSVASGQINVKVGYSVGLPQWNEVDLILDNYEAGNSQITQEFGSINVLHGLALGLRYRLFNTSFEVGWKSLSQEKKALIYDPGGDSFDDVVYGFGQTDFALGVYRHIGRFAFGTSLTSSKISISREIGQQDLGLVAESQYQLRLSASWVIQQSDYVSLSLEPYYQFSFDDYDITSFRIDASDIGRSSMLSPRTFGVSLVFYNGRQD